MRKYIHTFESFDSFNQVFYSCVKEPITFNEFIEKEVYGNKKFTQEDITIWMSEYLITLDDKVLWISPDKTMCYRFGDHNDRTPEITKYTLRDGFIIPESEDLHKGFLMVLRDNFSQN